MPVIKSAKKKLRRDKKIQKRNYLVKLAFEKAIKTARKSPSLEKIKKATVLVDKAAKKKLIHANKAARIKSSLSRLIKTSKKTPAKVTKKSSAVKPKKK